MEDNLILIFDGLLVSAGGAYIVEKFIELLWDEGVPE